MKDYIELGGAPYNEDCAQVGEVEYLRKAKEQCFKYIEQIRRYYPEPEQGYLTIKRFGHDFGSYYEVVAVYNTDDEDSCEWASVVESDPLDVLAQWG